jgi:hypothetical protein
MANPSIIRWYVHPFPLHASPFLKSYLLAECFLFCSGPDVPHCVSPRIGPALNYSIHACQATRPHGTNYKVHLEYKGQLTIGHLPRYLGDDGNITYATRTPSLLRSSVANSSTSSSTLYLELTTESEASTETAVVMTGHRNQSESESLAAKEAQEEEDTKQIIVGSVMGGFMLVILLGSIFGIWFAWRRSVRLREGKGVEFEMLDRDRGVEDVRDGDGVGRVERETP